MLNLGLALYLNAFHELDGERDLANYVPIARSQCFQYAHDYGFDAIQTDDLWYYVSRMDGPYLKYRFDNRPKKPPKGE